jgi:PAS domain S-box-containing protein
MAEVEQKTAEAQQRAEILHATFEAMHDPVLVYDREGLIQHANASAVRVHGFDPNRRSRLEAVGLLEVRRASGEIITPEQLPSTRALSGETVIAEPIQIINVQDRQVNVLVTATPLVIDGEQIGAVSVWHDVTETQALNAALLEARDRAEWLARLPEENPNPVARVSAEGIVLYHNPAAAQLPGWTCVVQSALPAPLLALVEWAMIQRREVQQDVHLGNRYYSVSVLSFPDEGYANLYGRDVTERKQVETALAESQRRTNDIIMSLSDGLFALDRQWNIIYINEQAASIAGRPIETLIGKNLWQFWPELRGTEVEQAYQQAMEERQPARFRVQGTYSNRWYDVNVYPSSEGITIFYVDKTVQVETEMTLLESESNLRHLTEKLKTSNQDLEQFAFVASHDLQEPLRKIMRFGESVADRLTHRMDENTIAETTDYLHRMQNAAERMQIMIDGLLNLSRISTHGTTFQQVSLSDIASEVISDLEPRIHQARGVIKVDPLPGIEADPLQMRQILQNLIGNALKFRKAGTPPVIHVHGEIVSMQDDSGSQLVMTVEDNGIGFNSADGKRIFKPFQRLHARSEYEGTGIGLAICQKIVERHHGSIMVESEPQRGSRFIVTLPVRQNEPNT